MKIIAADDEKIALEGLEEEIRSVLPEAEIYSFSKAPELIEFAENNCCDIAFLDIQMRELSGIEVAEKLKKHNSETNIIFTTA